MNKIADHDDDYVVESDDDSEDLASYKKGGYHPVKIGDVYNDRYTIESKLGWGHFSTVWLASDSKVPDDHTHKLVAIKVQKSETHYMEAAMDEIDLLNDARNHANDSLDAERGSRFVVQLLDHFFVHGPHGKHACLVFETMGRNTLSLIKKYEYKGIPPYIVKIMTRQLLEGLAYLHTHCHIIHTDLKPENFLLLPSEPFDLEQVTHYRRKIVADREAIQAEAAALSSDPTLGIAPAFDDGTLARSDRKLLKHVPPAYTIIPAGEPLNQSRKERGPFPWQARRRARQQRLRSLTPAERAVAAYTVKVSDLGNACWTHKHFTDDIATRQYRAPEVIVGLPYDTAVDMWAVACIVFELLTGDYLFDPKADAEGRHSRNEDHLALMRELLGAFPKRFQTHGKYSREYFTKKGEFHHIRDLQHWPLSDVFTDKYGMARAEAVLLSDTLLLPMLAIDPAERASAATCLESEWLQLTPTDVACMYRDYDLLHELHPAIALHVLLAERERAQEVIAFVQATRFSESRLERHLRRHCPYSTWLRDSRGAAVDLEAELARLRACCAALRPPGDHPGAAAALQLNLGMGMTVEEVNRIVREACADKVMDMVRNASAASPAREVPQSPSQHEHAHHRSYAYTYAYAYGNGNGYVHRNAEEHDVSTDVSTDLDLSSASSRARSPSLEHMPTLGQLLAEAGEGTDEDEDLGVGGTDETDGTDGTDDDNEEEETVTRALAANVDVDTEGKDGEGEDAAVAAAVAGMGGLTLE